MIDSFKAEFDKYRTMAEKSLGQVSDEDLNRVPAEDGNSMAMLVRHLSGNLTSRFTDFLTTDGEKPWRHRDREFEERSYTRAEVDELLESGWKVLEDALEPLDDRDLRRTVTIRGIGLSVHEALTRSLAHTAYHVGQIVLLARVAADEDWDWLTIPKGGTDDYNRNPTMEKGFRRDSTE